MQTPIMRTLALVLTEQFNQQLQDIYSEAMHFILSELDKIMESDDKNKTQ